MQKQFSNRLLAGAALAALAAPMSPSALAQDTEELASRMDTIVVTAGRREQPISDVQASVEVISSDEIQTFTGASVTEVLRQSVGVDARTSGANSTIAVRGQIPNAGSAVLFLFDGLPRTGKFGNVNLNNFPVEDVERIEIIRGPMSALYGANASGGVINVITKAAGEGAPLSVRVLGGTTLSDAGEGRETVSIGASANFSTGEVGHRVSLDWRKAKPYRFDDTVGVDDLSGIDHLSLTYSGAANTGETGRLRWTVEAYAQDDRSDGRTTTGTAFERFEQEDRYYGSLGYDVDLGPGSLALEASYGFSDGKVNRSFPGPDETTEYTQSLVQGRYFLPLGSHNLLFGAGAQTDEIDVSILTEVGEETNLFAFVQDEWDISDRIKLIAGLRVDDFDAFGSQVVPRLSIGSRGNGFTWRAGYGEAFRAPSVLEQYSRFTRGRFLITGSPDIEPEESKTWEAAIGWRGTKGNVELVYHDTEITNLIQAAPNGQVSGGLLVFAYQNIQEADISGVELAGNYDLGGGFAIDASYEYLDATDGLTGARLNGRARNTIKAALRWESGPWDMTLRGRHIGDLWGIDPVDRTRPAFASDYAVADLQIGYQLSPELALSFGVENIFDELTPLNWSSTGQIEDPAGRYAYLSLRYVMGGKQ
jgi:outer membrane receptor for ferrienterochelin and colicins